MDGQERLAIMMMVGLFKTGVISTPLVAGNGDDWEDAVKANWAAMRESTPDSVMAEALYKVAYETGANMGRTHRGLRYARMALELDPAHQKARLLVERLLPKTRETYPLTGD
jgi:hypothetical protein